MGSFRTDELRQAAVLQKRGDFAIATGAASNSERSGTARAQRPLLAMTVQLGP